MSVCVKKKKKTRDFSRIVGGLKHLSRRNRGVLRSADFRHMTVLPSVITVRYDNYSLLFSCRPKHYYSYRSVLTGGHGRVITSPRYCCVPWLVRRNNWILSQIERSRAHRNVVFPRIDYLCYIIIVVVPRSIYRRCSNVVRYERIPRTTTISCSSQGVLTCLSKKRTRRTLSLRSQISKKV